MSLIFEEETYVIRSAGCGFLEAVYAVIEKYRLSALRSNFQCFPCLPVRQDKSGTSCRMKGAGYSNCSFAI